MKKKLLLITGLLVLATAAFAEDEVMWTSSGRRAEVSYEYLGQYYGQKAANVAVSTAGRNSKPSADHWDLVRKVLNKYDTEKGDTVMIVMGFFFSHTIPTVSVFICEYTSATQYDYWFFEKRL
jgi:hypothetical protein